MKGNAVQKPTYDPNLLGHPDYNNDARWDISLNASEVWLLRCLLSDVPPGTEAAGQAGWILHDLEQEPTNAEELKFWNAVEDEQDQ